MILDFIGWDHLYQPGRNRVILHIRIDAFSAIKDVPYNIAVQYRYNLQSKGTRKVDGVEHSDKSHTMLSHWFLEINTGLRFVHSTRNSMGRLTPVVNAGIIYTQYIQHPHPNSTVLTTSQRKQCPPVLLTLAHPGLQISLLNAHSHYAIFPLPSAR